jgi:hypothetical protein
VGITDLTRAGTLISKRRQRGTSLAGHPEAGPRGQQPASHLARQSVRPLEPRLQAFGRCELLERLLVAAPAGVEHPGHEM